MKLVIFSFLSGCCLHGIKGVNFTLLENQRYSFGALTVVFNSLASCCPRGFAPSASGYLKMYFRRPCKIVRFLTNLRLLF